MAYRHSLKNRIRLSLVLFGALLSSAMAVGVYLALEDIEHQMLEQTLDAELDHFLNQPKPALGTVEQINADTLRYFLAPGQLDRLPGHLLGLSAGHHELDLDGRHYAILVTEVDDGRLYLVKDTTAFEEREKALQAALASAVGVAVAIALWLGGWLAGRVISPVSRLARQVSQLRPGSRHGTRVATQYANDEVGELAATFDRYMEQMEQFIRREQEFSADASHELRTPIAIITGAAEVLLENRRLDDQARRQLERILRAGERMSQTIDILLLLAREHPGNRASRNERCTLEEVARELVEHHRPRLGEREVELRAEIVNGHTLPVSRALLWIVLDNLLRNAIDHTDQGAICITVAGPRVEICDTGHGIPPEELRHIFNRHYRGQNTQASGSGIGLSIVKRICDRQHWHIEIDSTPGKGTCVTLLF